MEHTPSDEYPEKVLEHFHHPHNAGMMEQPDLVVMARNDVCGDTTKLYLKLTEGKISQVRFKTFGCAAAIAASSILTELIENQSLPDLRKVTKETISQALGKLPESKLHAAVLAEDLLHQLVIQNSSKL